MNQRLKYLVGTIMVAGAIVAVGCGEATDTNTTEVIGQTKEALTQSFALPIPVGLSPQDVVIGATNAVNINDAAFVDTLAPQALSTFWGNIAAFGPQTSVTNLGVSTQVGAVLTSTGLMMRGGTLEFYKARGGVQAQVGTAFRQAAENDNPVTVLRDPIWTVQIIAPDSGPNHTANPGTTVELGDGNYGSVIVNGGTLRLTGNSYGFVELVLNSGSTVQLTSPSPTRLFVRNNLILRAPVQKAGTTIGYLGAGTVAIEAGFQGDLFLAPNASLEIKANSIGHFFAQNVTVFEQVNVRGSVLTQDAQNRVRPTDSFIQRGGTNGLSPTDGSVQTEISSAILTTLHSPSCTVGRPLALTTFAAPALIRSASLGLTSNSLVYQLAEPTAPAACLGVLAGVPGAAYPVFPELGTALYAPAYTDNVTARLPGGRALEIGLEGRFCLDSKNGPNCPATQPTSGSPCNGDTTPTACYYSSNYALCSGTTWVVAPHSCPASIPTAGGMCSTSTNPVPCWYDTTPPSPPPPAPPFPPAPAYCACNATAGWTCGTRQRKEGRYLAVRMTSTCGASASAWDVAALDPQVMGISDGTRLSRVLDRQELHVDPLGNRIYLAFQTSPIEDGFGAPGSRDIVLSGDASAATAAALTQSLVSSLASPLPAPGTPASPLLARNMPSAGSYQPMATVRDERALLPGGGTGPWSHLLRLQCVGDPASAAGATPMLEVTTPVGVIPIDLRGGDSTKACKISPSSSVGGPLVINVIPGLSVVGVQGVPPRARVMWTGFRNGYQMVFGASVTIRRVNGYSQPILRSDFTIESPSAHILWPQFIAPDHFSGSNMLFDTPVVIRWAQAGGNTITEQATVYASGLFGRVFNLASWNVSDAFPGRTCPGVITQPGSCFAGDYRYGAFWEKTAAGALSYYTPWTGFSSASGMGSPTGASRMRAFGGMITVTP